MPLGRQDPVTGRVGPHGFGRGRKGTRAWRNAIRPAHRGLLVAFLLAVAAGVPAFAQVSPGPLSRAHADLEGSTKCFRCHRTGEAGLDAQCLACHREIAALVAATRGLHGREGKDKCAKCHPEHAGVDFSLTNWPAEGPREFDHQRAGWPLAGKHQGLACRQCHQPKFRVGPEAASAQRRDPAKSWLGLDPACAACHEDIHKSALGRDCAKCHSAASWKIERYDHSRTAFPLVGGHLKVACAKCHLDPRRPLPVDAAGATRPLFKPLPHARCTDCHQDPHAGRLGTTCEKCHNADNWKAVPKSAFDHDRTRYPLTGLHRAVACAKCHDEKTAWGARPRFESCGTCHRDAHAGKATLAGKPADCASCHDTGGWRNTTYTVERHRAAAYPLTGLHAKVACDQCHRKDATTAGLAAFGSAGVMIRVKHGRCLDCHTDAHRGEFSARVDGGACESCHGTEGWRPSRFTPRDHAQTHFLLDGRHVDVPCGACHGPDRKSLPPLPAAKPEAPGAVVVRAALRGIGNACTDCHRDPHGGRYSKPTGTAPAMACTDCHDTRAFGPTKMSEAAHARTGYPLEGAHRAVPCQACHKELEAPPAVSSLLLASGPARRLEFRDPRRRCAECHADPHLGQFASGAGGGACEQCHEVEAFRPASRFDHSRGTRFALGGAHARVPCARCHPAVKTASGGVTIRYLGLPIRCEGCHGATTPVPGVEPHTGSGG